jgi:hypothetical protein
MHEKMVSGCIQEKARVLFRIFLLGSYKSNSSQNGKNISRKGAKLAKKGQTSCSLKQHLKVFLASGACPRMNLSGTALRETPFIFDLSVPACPG